MYGYNFKSIIYPFSDSPAQHQVWMERMNGIVNIPSKLIPTFDANETCKHNHTFNISDDTLVRESANLCLFNDYGERTFSTEVFARPTVGACRCLQRVDGNDFLIWNLGKGRFVDYSLLLSYLHKWRSSGISMYALHQSIWDVVQSCGVTS